MNMEFWQDVLRCVGLACGAVSLFYMIRIIVVAFFPNKRKTPENSLQKFYSPKLEQYIWIAMILLWLLFFCWEFSELTAEQPWWFLLVAPFFRKPIVFMALFSFLILVRRGQKKERQSQELDQDRS